jgi:antitoxin component HigA of HigAB toxin-antitoxin module
MIRTVQGYRSALETIERLMDSNPLPGTLGAYRLRMLAQEVEEYERDLYPLPEEVFLKSSPLAQARERLQKLAQEAEEMRFAHGVDTRDSEGAIQKELEHQAPTYRATLGKLRAGAITPAKLVTIDQFVANTVTADKLVAGRVIYRNGRYEPLPPPAESGTTSEEVVYRYSDEREKLFTDDGQRLLLRVRDQVQRLLKEAGAVRANEALRGILGDSWQHQACLDRLVELGELAVVTEPGVRGPDRVFVARER